MTDTMTFQNIDLSSWDILYTVEVGYNVRKETEYFVSFKTIVVITEE